MKKILGIAAVASFLVFMVWVFSYAVNTDTWRSSNTATADTTLNLCPGKQYLVEATTYTEGNHGVFHGACVNRGVAGTLTVYNSSASANVPIAAISTSTPMPCSLYDVTTSSGLTYSNTGASDITILYMCY